MNKRINTIPPTPTVHALDKVQSQPNLRERLKHEAIANAERDLRMAAEWFPLEEEACQLAQRKKKGK